MGSASSKSRRRRFVWRTAAYVGVALVALIAVGALGYHVFTGWRARDLAGKAKENVEQGNFRMAWLQINSAKELRSEDPEVLRAAALIEAGFGRPEALDHLQKLAGQTQLTPEDLSARASAALRHGTDEQFEQAVADLEKRTRFLRPASCGPPASCAVEILIAPSSKLVRRLRPPASLH